MSLSRESRGGGRPNVIKLNSHPGKLTIVDYGSVIEEIEADRKNVVTVDVDDIVGATRPAGEGGTENESGVDYEEAAKEAASEAYRQGYEAGRDEASKKSRDEFERRIGEISEDFSSLTREFAAEVARYDQDFEKAIVTLALAVARRVVAREIEADEGAVLARSREAIRKIIGVEKIKIHVSPSDEEYIREHRNELSTYADSVKEIVIEADSKVERGGCVIESDLGNIDARVSTQFELIEEALLGLIK